MLKIIVPKKDAFQVIDYQIDSPVRGVPHLCVVRSPGCGNLDGYHRLLKFGNSGKVILTFNYSSDQRTITLNEINGGLQEGVRISPSDVHQ